MAGIENLEVVHDSSGHAYGTSGIKAFTAPSSYLISVIATNTTSLDGHIYVYVIPEGSTNYASPNNWAPIAYNLPLPSNNSYETFRFGINFSDEVWVAGSAGMRYFVQGINQV
jgi:hypothetical protein